MPFRKQHDYWSKAGGGTPERAAADLQNKSSFLAE